MSQRSDYRVNITITSKDKTKNETKKAATGFGDLKKALQVAAVAYGTLKTAQAAVDFVKAGAAIKRQQGALNNLAKAAGTSGDAIVSAIQSASDHTIDRMTAMSVANKALLLNVADTPEKFSELTRVATLLGRAMGQDAATSINDFVVAAGRQSVMIADNLGLMVSAETANQKYADSHGILVSAMGKAEKSQAFLNEMLEQGAEKAKALETSTLSAADKIEQAEASISDIKGSFQELSAEIAVSSGTLDRWSAGLAGWKSVIDNAKVASEHFEEQTERDRRAMEQAIRTTDQMNVTRLRSQDLVEIDIDNSAEMERRTRAVENATRASRVETMLQTGELKAAVDPWGQYREAIDGARTATLEMKAAQDLAKIAAENHMLAQMDLSTVLKTSDQQAMGLAAIAQLKVALDEGKISFDEYRLAVTDVQLQYGLATMASIGMAENMTALTAKLADGTITAAEYATQLAVITGNANDGTNAFENYKTALDAIPREIVIRIREELAVAPSRRGGGIGGGAQQAAGGISEGGRTLVGELGPEFVDMPRGSMVHNAGDTSNMMNSGNTYNVNDPAGAAMMVEQARAASQSRFARGAGM